MPRIITPAAPGTQSSPLDGFSPIGAICSWALECGSYGATPTGFDSWNNALTFVANKAWFVPFVLNETVTVDGVAWYNGTAIGSNIDVGIYDFFGNLLVSCGPTAQNTIQIVQTVAITSTILRAGNYFIAMAKNNLTGNIRGINQSTIAQQLLGVKQMATAFPLPPIATLSDASSTGYPYISAFTQTVF